jgi:hypothetical protein
VSENRNAWNLSSDDERMRERARRINEIRADRLIGLPDLIETATMITTELTLPHPIFHHGACKYSYK